jgi:hypothetical protein
VGYKHHVSKKIELCLLFTVIGVIYCVGVGFHLWLVWLMVFNATFNNISVISWRSVILVEETGVPGENYRPVVSH